MNANGKKQYDNGNVIIVASEPSELRRKYTQDRMKQIRGSSQGVLEALNEINNAYPQKTGK